MPMFISIILEKRASQSIVRQDNELMDLTLIKDLYQAKLADNESEAVENDYLNFFNQFKTGLEHGTIDLTKMHTSFNVFSRLPQIIRQSGIIWSLKLYGNCIRDSEMQRINQILSTNPMISHIDIGCNEMTDISMTAIIDVLTNYRILSLQLGQTDSLMTVNRFTRDSMYNLIEFLAQIDRLKSFGIAGIGTLAQRKTSKFGLFSTSLANMIRKCRNLLNIDMSDCGFIDSDQSILSLGFQSNESLQRLSIKNNPFTDSSIILHGISQLKNLIYLNISKSGVTSSGIEHLCKSFNHNWGLISLNISENPIGTKGVASLLKTLSNNNYLVILNLSSTQIGPEIGFPLKEFLLNNQVIQDLDLSKNNLGETVAFLLEECLAEQHNLLNFSISSCRITSSGGVAIAKSLAVNDSIQYINLRDNFLTKASGYEIVSILQKNDTLQRIDLFSNQIDCFAIEAADVICQRNKSSVQDKLLSNMRKRYIQLSIVKSKIPASKERLKFLKDQVQQSQREISKIQIEIDKESDELAENLSKFLKEKRELELFINDKQKSISEMKGKMNEVLVFRETQISDITESIKKEKDIFDQYEKEAKKYADDIERIKTSSANEEEFLAQETENIEKLITEISRASRNKNSIKDYIIPDVPYLGKNKSHKEIAKIASVSDQLKLLYDDIVSENDQKTKSKKQLVKKRQLKNK